MIIKGVVLLLLVALSSAVVYERCTWAKLLKSQGMDGFHGISLPNWVCLTNWESHFNTNAINHNRDGSTDYGIFQINSRWWCDDRTTTTSNACNVACETLRSSVSASIRCAKRVVQDPQGLSAWVAWRVHCQGRDLSEYIRGVS
uniref:lysozyme n=1 Tax=Cynoglossus semilaevis TaxID=244447 RepID=A0A3P8WGJ8_CYNSE